ncbi:MAG TPA: hypothetical protein VH208_01030 [Myxococcaceae bacterium]|jgi:predicted phage terminase large subunit-like protein|nr:hypothetical protein [Myxococcaceae bacterium]
MARRNQSQGQGPPRLTRTPSATERAGRPWNVTLLRAIAPDGQLAWPEHNDIEAYRDIWESGGSAYFQCVWMQDPAGLAGEVFRPEWFQYFAHPAYTEDRPSSTRPGQTVTLTAEDLLAAGDVQAIIPDLRELFSIQACDLAIRQSDTADYYARVNAHASRQAELFIEDVYQARHTETEMVEDILRASERYKARAVGIESVAFQSLVFRMVTRKSQRHFVELDPANRDKVLRARPLAARYQMGRVYHLYGARWQKPYEFQLQEFPGGRHDDMVDAAAYVHELAVRFQPDTWKDVQRVQEELRTRRVLDDAVAPGGLFGAVTGGSGRLPSG